MPAGSGAAPQPGSWCTGKTGDASRFLLSLPVCTSSGCFTPRMGAFSRSLCLQHPAWGDGQPPAPAPRQGSGPGLLRSRSNAVPTTSDPSAFPLPPSRSARAELAPRAPPSLPPNRSRPPGSEAVELGTVWPRWFSFALLLGFVSCLRGGGAVRLAASVPARFYCGCVVFAWFVGSVWRFGSPGRVSQQHGLGQAPLLWRDSPGVTTDPPGQGQGLLGHPWGRMRSRGGHGPAALAGSPGVARASG